LSASVPQMQDISTMASRSSALAKKGNCFSRKEIIITPTDHMSSAVFCSCTRKRTSGARNPRVPARGAAARFL
jgi:hypothetical protein